ncbi:diguanylate cyclase [Pseudomonas sp. HMWF032]|uniref:HD-GYP domain-containing protein n=1 Tax=unclassified Pseudomonas TaxID=196821 RepID=UPI000D3BC0C7|nr:MULTISPECIES: HD-GYP domain-containing protein [unclassified Pseudomonas]PTS82349.1 diguanylate cyclase [Pseudomonas sp. HMWF032]PTT72718.1 diguanylate cyclase [Pseudomonas sp. HMWF010]WAC46075.1 HD-GYP domain-containing protein [Pseudomonas sp. SL4(2022)]
MAADTHTDRIKVEAAQLTIGMYVVELDRPWTDTSFLFQGFRIRQQQEIRLLQEACRYVWVDASRSIGMLSQLTENLAQPDNLQPVIAKVEFNLEIQQAAPTWHAAREESLRILQAIKMGQELDVGAVKAVIKDCVESILRNPAAMLWLARIKNSDDYTAEHSLRVSILSIALGKELGLPAYQLEQIGVCGMLHDVGKIKVPSEILNKPGALTHDELRIMQSHAAEGRKLLMSNQQITPATVDVAYSHHERLDGKGYPRGLDASKIPYFAKIIAVADSYDAINSDRIYSKGKSSLESLRILFDATNSHFDEEIVGCFIRLIGIYPPGEIVELNTGEVGIIIGCAPGNKLKPRVIRVLDAEKQPCKESIIDLTQTVRDAAGKPYRIREVHSSGAFGIDIEAYRRKGLMIPDNL